MEHSNELEKLLKSRNIRITSKRMALLNVLASEDKAVARSVLQKKIENIDRVTLYRTINTLIDTGIIHIAHIDNDDVFYAMCKHHCSPGSHSHKHIHFKCKKCEAVKCVETLDEAIVKLPGFVIDEVNIEVKGICDCCMVL